MQIMIKPLDGVYWEDKCLRLGDNREMVMYILEKQFPLDGSCYCFGNELRIDFDSDDCVNFIEFIAGTDGYLKPIIHNISAFDVSADQLYEVLAEHNKGYIVDDEDGYSYGFLNISVGIYRERTPESVEEMIQEMKEEGIDVWDYEDIEVEKKKANYWATIGIGKEDYYG